MDDAPGEERLGIVSTMIFPKGAKLRTIPLGLAAGLKMNIDFSRHKKLWLGLYEVELNKHIKKLCRAGYNCFDVGGQSGYDALILAKLTGGRVLSFEVDPEACAEMEATFEANEDLSSRIGVVRGFVGDVSDPANGRTTLDEVARSSGGFVPDLVKIDIEGGELEALRGAVGILEERHPHLIIETHSSEIDAACSGFLTARGYEPTAVENRSWFPDHRPVAFNRWLIAEGRY